MGFQGHPECQGRWVEEDQMARMGDPVYPDLKDLLDHRDPQGRLCMHQLLVSGSAPVT